MALICFHRLATADFNTDVIIVCVCVCVCVCICMCVCYRADSAGVVLLHVGTQGGVAGISPRAQGALSLTRLLVARLLPQVVEAEGQAVPGVHETALAQVAVLRDQDLERGDMGGFLL